MAWHFPSCCFWCRAAIASLLAVEGAEDFRLYGTTMDDAVGEAFDKTAKLLGLPYPGGPNVESARRDGNAKRLCAAAAPAGARTGMDFSFSGLKTAVRQLAQNARAVSTMSAPRSRRR